MRRLCICDRAVNYLGEAVKHKNKKNNIHNIDTGKGHFPVYIKYHHYSMRGDTISRNNTVCMSLQQARVQCASADTRISLYDVLSHLSLTVEI